MDMETITMQLLVNSGDARSKAMEAIGSAKAGNISQAREQLKEAGDFLSAAHQFQTEIIQEEADGNIKNVSVLMTHDSFIKIVSAQGRSMFFNLRFRF